MDDWAALTASLQKGERGHLLISRTASSALKALEMAEMDVSSHGAEDPRGFATLLTAPLLSMAHGAWRHVWLLDGEIAPQEAECWRVRLPRAQVHILPRSAQIRRMAAAIDAGDEAYRRLYKALRTGAFRTLAQTAQAVQLTEAQTRAGLHAFRQLGLIEYSEAPFRCHLCPPQKCALGDSRMLGAVRRLAENDEARE